MPYMIWIGGYRAVIRRLPTGRGPWWVAGGILATCGPCTYLVSWASKGALPGGCVHTAQAAAEQPCQLRGYVPWRQVSGRLLGRRLDRKRRVRPSTYLTSSAYVGCPVSDRLRVGCIEAPRVGSSAHDEVAPDVPHHPPARNRRSPSDPVGRASPRTRGPRGGRAHQRRSAPVDDHAAAVATAAGPPRPVGRQAQGTTPIPRPIGRAVPADRAPWRPMFGGRGRAQDRTSRPWSERRRPAR